MIALILLAFLSQSSARADQSQLLFNIFGPDSRVTLERGNAHSKRIFRMSNGCTGFLVGEEWALTAAHCVEGKVERKYILGLQAVAFDRITSPITARFDYIAGRSGQDVEVVEVVRMPGPGSFTNRNDWALLKLASAVGAQRGFYPVIKDVAPQDDENGRDLVLIGYSADLADSAGLTAHVGCQLRGVDPDYDSYRHDCDMTRGASGAPLLKCDAHGLCRVAAINAGERRDGDTSMTLPSYSDDRANLATPIIEVSLTVQKVVPGAVVVNGNPRPSPQGGPPSRLQMNEVGSF